MGIVLFSATTLFGGLQGVIGWLGTSGQPSTGPRTASTSEAVDHPAAPRVWHRPRRAPLRPQAQYGQTGVAVARAGSALPNTLPRGLHAGMAVDKGRPARAARPLRVVRVLDAVASQSSSAGRMVISGRMADVCAELDRLAALEAATSPVMSLQ